MLFKKIHAPILGMPQDIVDNEVIQVEANGKRYGFTLEQWDEALQCFIGKPIISEEWAKTEETKKFFPVEKEVSEGLYEEIAYAESKEEAEEAEEEFNHVKGNTMTTKKFYTLYRESVELPRTNEGKRYAAYYPGVSLDAQSDHYPVELKRSEVLADLEELLNSDACRPYIETAGNGVTVYAEYYIEEATYESDEDSDEWEFLEGSDYYTRERESEPARNKSKANL